MHAHDAFDDVVDVGEVADHPAIVEDLDRLAGQDAAREPEERHVGAAPRAVHGEETEPGARQPKSVRVRVRHQLVGLLRGGVERDRVVDVVVLGERLLRVRAVDGARRGEDEVLDAVVPASLEDVQEALRLASTYACGLDERVAHARLGREVDHALRLRLGEEAAHAVGVGDVEALEAKAARAAQEIEPRFLQPRVVVVVDVVDADDVVAAVEQPPARRGIR